MTADLRDQLQITLGPGYAVERELVGGGMSRVFVVEERTLGRRIVVKVLPPDHGGRISVERFRREIQLAARLQHPHIVPLLGAGETSGLIYYTMPLVDGESLRERLRRERQLPVEEALQITREVADALAYAHQHGVVHRDIKPENILLSAGHAVVADFGIARAVTRAAGDDTLTLTGTTIGTPAYMSPEQAAGERDIDGRSDTYSLGCVLFEMLAGEPPFTGPTAQAVMAKRFTGSAPKVTSARPAVPQSLEAAVTKALALVPADRFRTTADFARALGESLASPRSNAGHPTAGAEAALRDVAHAMPDRRSIAVLPFANVSADPENEYFSDGITEDIISQLSKIAHLKVISRTSTTRYKNTQKSVREIAGELGVVAILEGSVRRAGNRVRVVAQLIDAGADEHLWAETYDRDLTDVFAIQSDVALQVASGLRAVLASGERKRVERKPTESVEAYNWLLLGRYALNKRIPEQLKKAIECFHAAIAADAKYAAAYAGLADAYTLSAIGYGAAPTDTLPRAKAAALEALSLDETLADAHTSLGYVHLNYDWDFFAAEREFRRAIELSPSAAQAYEWFGHALMYIGHQDEALGMMQRARDLDPLSVVLTAETAWPHYFKRDLENALTYTRRALAMDPRFALARYNLATEWEAIGKTGEALAEAESSVRDSGGMGFFVAYLGRLQGLFGERDKARGNLADLTERARRGEAVNWFVAQVLDGLGERDQVFEWLERAYAAREPMMAWLHLAAHPGFENVRSDARFQAFLDRIGMAEQARRFRSAR